MSNEEEAPTRQRPSQRWTSYDDWDYGGMMQRLASFMASINKPALIEHAEAVLSTSITLSEPFSAGQYWCCFELVAADGRLAIARVRLPRHPDSGASEDDEAYLMQCKTATMEFVRENVTAIPVPALYVCAMPGSLRAVEAGAPYMLIEGFYGNSLQDVDSSIYNLPTETQEHIFAQWTSIQAELAAFSFPQIGSISCFCKGKGAVIGPLAVALADGLPMAEPFDSAVDYLAVVPEARLSRALQNSDSTRFTALGLYVFEDIVRNTDHYTRLNGPFPSNHMDMGMQNLLVDDSLNIVSVIDWEMAQSAPWEVFHYPMPSHMLVSDEKIARILDDPGHLAHRNTARQSRSREMYRAKFAAAEASLAQRGRGLPVSVAAVLAGDASRMYEIVEKIGVFEGMEEMLTYELVRLGYGLTGEEAEEKVLEMESEMRALYPDFFKDTAGF